MKRSTGRILTTHVGSLIRPAALREFLAAKEAGKPFDQAAYARCLKDSVAEVVRRQADIGIDVISDGEFGKAISWAQYARAARARKQLSAGLGRLRLRRGIRTPRLAASGRSGNGAGGRHRCRHLAQHLALCDEPVLLGLAVSASAGIPQCIRAFTDPMLQALFHVRYPRDQWWVLVDRTRLTNG